MKRKTSLDFKQLTAELHVMEYHSPLFRLLKRELSLLGYWRNKPRGNPRKGFDAMKGKGVDY